MPDNSMAKLGWQSNPCYGSCGKNETPNFSMVITHKNPEYEIASRAHYFLMLIDYKEHQLSEEVIREMGEGHYKKKWKRPCQGSISVATEASVIVSGGAGLGLVIRDGAGRFLAAAACCKEIS
ncbi:unnamed protein product [Linum trigynum]|uniref:Uncharacterized protein n=1 Tax=Linum trigynum TaxID=586398 RepID=A0AAV2FFJ7_9ROSI